MKVTPTIIRHELIGLRAKVIRSSHKGYIGISGEVVDETRNTIVILHKGEKKVVVKEVATFHFTMPNSTVVEVDGRAIVGRPEDRLKRRVKRLW